MTADADRLSITVEKGLLTVADCQGKNVEITDLRGTILYSGVQSADKFTRHLSAGLYIVTVEARSEKVLVP